MENNNDLGNIILGTSLVVIPHAACFSLGAFKGSMNAKGIDLDIPFTYLLASNVGGTSLGRVLLREPYDSKMGVASKGALLGAVAAPIEYVVGYGISYWGHKIIETVFF